MENQNYSGVLPSSTSAGNLSGENAPLAQSESVHSLSKMEPANADETGQVKYTKESEAKNGEATVEIGPVETKFAGMNKEELMQYANDPFWVGIRWFLFILFWVAWAGMLAGAIAIIVLAPRCTPRAEWQKSPLYQVYSRSFQDSDGDGSGDLKGIESRLDHFTSLGVKMVGLSAIFKTPMKDYGTDISNFVEVDPMYGSMEDFEKLVAEMKSKGLRLVLDLIPNHSSDEHPWFQESIKKSGNFTDYYIWHAGKDVNGIRSPPNNWLSLYGDSAWEWNEERKEYYLHQYSKHQPDLNYRNPLVKEELKRIVRFWLDKGVEGFRVQGLPYLFEDAGFRDEPPSNSGADANEYGSLDHIYTSSLPEVYSLLAEIRAVLGEFEEKDKQHRVLFTEANVQLEELIKYYGNTTGSLADIALNYGLIEATNQGVNAFELNSTVGSFLNAVPSFAWPNWVLGNEESSRLASRSDPELVDAYAMVQMLLPGTPVIYYGEEIGMTDNIAVSGGVSAPGAAGFNKPTRDPVRTPMQWNNSQNAGFSSAAQTWLPVNLDYPSVNVESQTTANASHFKVYQALIKERLTNPILFGDMEYAEVTDTIFSFTRIHQGSSPGYLVVINVAYQDQTVDFSRYSKIGAEAEVLIASVGSSVATGDKILTKAVPVAAKQGLVLTFNPV